MFRQLTRQINTKPYVLCGVPSHLLTNKEVDTRNVDKKEVDKKEVDEDIKLYNKDKETICWSCPGDLQGDPSYKIVE